jgi:four helix bundle protein
MAVSRFEDLIAWQEARALAGSIHAVSKRGAMAQDFGFANQIQRAGVSSMSSVAEGFELGSQREFQRYLCTAKGSVGEVRSLLYLASDIGYLDQSEFNSLMDPANETVRVIGALRAAVQRRIQARLKTSTKT